MPRTEASQIPNMRRRRDHAVAGREDAMSSSFTLPLWKKDAPPRSRSPLPGPVCPWTNPLLPESVRNRLSCCKLRFMKTSSPAPLLSPPSGSHLFPGLLAAVAFLLFLLPGVLGPYGIFIDEYYYLACSKRLAWGFVDHPPLAPAMLRVSRLVFGDSIWALRVPVALLGALTVWMTAMLARRLGAGTLGHMLAGVAVMSGTVAQIFFGVFSMNALKLVIWLGCGWLLIEIEIRNQPRLWLAFGALELLHDRSGWVLGRACGVRRAPAWVFESACDLPEPTQTLR